MDENLKNFGLSKELLKNENLERTISPYLNKSLIKDFDEPEYISLDGGRGYKRGRFELAFGQIGIAVLLGANIGGVTGLYNGLSITNVADITRKLRTTQVLNHVMKHGSGTANAFGTIGVFYSALGVGLSYLRKDDDFNTIIAATLTGHLYKATAGLKKCGIAGLIGFSLSSLFCLYKNSDQLFKLPMLNKK